jgi:polar amino acid transport system substrate-binding protein
VTALRPIALGLLVAALLGNACAASDTGDGGDTLARIKQRGTLRWGADIQGGEPYVFEDPERPGHWTGFEAEIAEVLARELGVRAELVQNDWSTLVPSLERGTFDVIMNGLEVTPARKQRIAFTEPYYTFREQLVAREGDTRIHGLASVRGLRVGTLANSLAWDMLEPAGALRIPYEGVEEPFLDLAQRRTDAVLLDDVIVARYGTRSGLRVAANVGIGTYAIGVRKEDAALLHALDAALSRMLRSGELGSILGRWHLRAAPDALTPEPAGAEPPNATILPGPGETSAPHGSPMPTELATPAAAGAGSDVPAHATFSLSPHQLALFMQAAGFTLLISSCAMLLAVALGLLLAVARLPSPLRWRRIVRAFATGYVELLRGTPVLLQLYVIYYGLAPLFAFDALPAAVLGLGLNYAAYEAEIYRAGIQAVPRGEVEAAYALGMSGALAFRRVVLPQAFRFALPGVANDFIALLKDSSLVSVITVVELTKRMTIAAVDGHGWMVPGALCAAFYFAMSYPLSRLARTLEARLGAEA